MMSNHMLSFGFVDDFVIFQETTCEVNIIISEVDHGIFYLPFER